MKESTFQFLEELEKNNEKTWFDRNRQWYEEARADFLAFFDMLTEEIAAFDRGVAENVELSRKIFRIYRDVRFSKDKTPYKSHLSGAIVPGGMKSGLAGYYVQVQPGGRSGVAGGMHDADTATLNRVRLAVSRRYGEFSSILGSPDFNSEFGDLHRGDVLKRGPKGFDPEDPAVEYLKLKAYMVWKDVDDREVLKDGFLNSCIKSFRILKKLNDFLNDAAR
jgi:uncharacterized protein (TIGR02453 family)